MTSSAQDVMYAYNTAKSAEARLRKAVKNEDRTLIPEDIININVAIRKLAEIQESLSEIVENS
jgi:hypothetical protein